MRKLIFATLVAIIFISFNASLTFANDLPKFVQEVLKQMPKNHRLQSNQIVFLKNTKELDNLRLSISPVALENIKREYAAFQYNEKIYICGWSSNYSQAEAIFLNGHQQTVWIWVARMAHERFHMSPHPNLTAQQEELEAYRLQFSLIEKFELEKKFVGISTYLAQHKAFLRNIVDGLSPATEYVLVEKV